MAGINIKEVKKISIETTDGQQIREGDLLLITVRTEDIICYFKEYNSNGYIVTAPVSRRAETVNYRPSSIIACYKVDQFKLSLENEILDAAPAAGEYADAGALASATE